MKKIIAASILVLMAFACSGCAHPYWGDVAPAMQQTAADETPAAAPQPSASQIPELSVIPIPSASTIPSSVPSPSGTPAPAPSPTEEPAPSVAPGPSATPAQPSLTLEGAYVHDPAYDDWYDGDVGLPLSYLFTKDKMLWQDANAQDIHASDWEISDEAIIAYNADQALYYKGQIYFLKANSLYRVRLDGTGLRLLREFNQERFIKEYTWQDSMLAYCDTVTQIFIADGYLYYIMDFSKKDIDYAAENLYRMDLSGNHIRLIQKGVHHISYGADGKLYFEVAMGHYRELYVGGDGEGAYKGYDYTYDLFQYDIKSGQRLVLVADAENAEGGSYTLWLNDKLYYRSGTWRHSEADQAMYEIDLKTREKRPYPFLIDQMMPVMRYRQFLFYHLAETGQMQGIDLSTGQKIKIENCDGFFLVGGQPVVQGSDSYYKLYFMDGKFMLEPYVPQ